MWGCIVPGLYQQSEAACHGTHQTLTVTGCFAYGKLLKAMQEKYTQQPGKAACVLSHVLPSISQVCVVCSILWALVEDKQTLSSYADTLSHMFLRCVNMCL